jgi:hypothetical protein
VLKDLIKQRFKLYFLLMQIVKLDSVNEYNKIYLLIIIIATAIGLYFVYKKETSPEGIKRRKAMEKTKRKKINNSYSHIPQKYRELCATDDDILKNTFRDIGGFIIGDSNKASKFAGNISSGVFQTRQSKYINIVADLKLDVNSRYRDSFVKEAKTIISEMKADIPSSWVSYTIFIEWCLKFVERHPVGLSNKDYIEEPELDLRDIKEQLNKESKSRREQL